MHLHLYSIFEACDLVFPTSCFGTTGTMLLMPTNCKNIWNICTFLKYPTRPGTTGTMLLLPTNCKNIWNICIFLKFSTRAGTTGTMLLMHFQGRDSGSALQEARSDIFVVFLAGLFHIKDFPSSLLFPTLFLSLPFFFIPCPFHISFVQHLILFTRLKRSIINPIGDFPEFLKKCDTLPRLFLWHFVTLKTNLAPKT